MLELYHMQQCPYSKKVRDYIEQNNLKSKIQYFDIADDFAAADRLENMTDSTQVPCLVINGEPMQESDDIITWLGENMVSNEESKFSGASL